MALIGSAALVAGFFGALYPALDSLSHFRLHGAALTALAGAVALFGVWWQRMVGVGALALSAVAALSVADFAVPGPSGATAAAGGGETLTLLQMNMLYSADPAPALALIEALAPDVVTLQEVVIAVRPALAKLEAYPHQAFCGRARRRGAMAVLSRHPFAPDAIACHPWDGYLAAPIAFGDATARVASQHFAWPWPFGQWRQLAAIADDLSGTRAPALVAGDFNAAPWSALVEAYARRSGTRALEGIGLTWLPPYVPQALTPFLGLAIDNVLASDEVRVLSARVLPPTRSDHRPIWVRFALPDAPVRPLAGGATAHAADPAPGPRPRDDREPH